MKNTSEVSYQCLCQPGKITPFSSDLKANYPSRYFTKFFLTNITITNNAEDAGLQR